MANEKNTTETQGNNGAALESANNSLKPAKVVHCTADGCTREFSPAQMCAVAELVATKDFTPLNLWQNALCWFCGRELQNYLAAKGEKISLMPYDQALLQKKEDVRVAEAKRKLEAEENARRAKAEAGRKAKLEAEQAAAQKVLELKYGSFADKLAAAMKTAISATPASEDPKAQPPRRSNGKKGRKAAALASQATSPVATTSAEPAIEVVEAASEASTPENGGNGKTQANTATLPA